MTPTPDDDESGALMHQGIALLNANTPASLGESLGYFDAAIRLRRDALQPGDPRACYLLAASWLNRGDALTRLGGPACLPEALRSYDEALAVLRGVPPDADPLYRRRHAIAWTNRGLTLLALGTPEALAEALRSFERAVAETRDHVGEQRLVLAGAWTNHGHTLLRTPPARSAEARESASTALGLVEGIDAQDVTAAEISLKAQIVVCQAAAELLERGNPGPAEARALVCAATDAIEAGLRLAADWEQRGETGLGSLPTALFHFGIAVYRRYQPQFLTEFITENLRDSRNLERHAIAAEALAAALPAAARGPFAVLQTPDFSQTTETFQTLQAVKQRMRELKR